jgi:hypothetical protein
VSVRDNDVPSLVFSTPDVSVSVPSALSGAPGQPPLSDTYTVRLSLPNAVPVAVSIADASGRVHVTPSSVVLPPSARGAEFSVVVTAAAGAATGPSGVSDGVLAHSVTINGIGALLSGVCA